MSSPESGDGLTGEEIYCICRSTDCSRFMIGCDRCNEWYHGDCINITQEESNFIKHFYCHLCRGKDPNLKIKYKHKKKKDKEREKEKLKKDKYKHHKDKDKKHRSDKHHDKHRDRDHKKSSDKSRHGDGSSKKHKDGHSSKHKEHDHLKENRAKESKVLQSTPEKPKPPPTPMEESPRPEPPRPPLPTPVSTPAPLATVMDTSDFMGLDDDLDDVDLTEPMSEEDQLRLQRSLPDMLPSNHMMLSRAAAAKKSTRRCGECVACNRTEDCARCDFCKDMRKFGGPNRIRQKCRLRQCLNFGLLKTQALKMAALAEKALGGAVERSVTSVTEHQFTMFVSDSENDDFVGKHQTPPRKYRKSDSEYSTPGRKKGKEKGRKYEKKQKKAPSKESRPRTKRKAEEDFEDVVLKVEEDQSPRQCLGPGCIEVAREGSKYCSDDCGMKLATNRIFEILPQRIQQWQVTQCVAEENNKQMVERIRAEQLQARQRLVELDLRHQELDALIARAKRIILSPDSEQDTTDAEEEGEYSVYCVTCGHEVSQRSAIKHMERCFVKFESQTSFGSIYKTRIEGNSMFCDFYNAQAKTYCKRLKVLCPEHSKEPKTGPNEVCGCPIKSKTFEDTKELCQTPRLKCNKHYCWEKLRRAAIDLERVRQWMKLDDLFEQERQIRLAMSNRAGVLGLMLHQTIDHNPMKPIKSKA